MRKYLKPSDGMLIRDPVLKDRLPPEGRCVEMTPYWTRRLIDQDVEEAPDPDAKPGAETEKPHEKPKPETEKH